MMTASVTVLLLLLLLAASGPAAARLNVLNWLRGEATALTPSDCETGGEEATEADGASDEADDRVEEAYRVYEAAPAEAYAVYYRSQRIDIPRAGVTTLAELGRRTRRAFRSEHIARFVTYVGAPIDALEAVPRDGRLLALHADEHFMFPALKVGEVVDIHAGDRHVSVRTLSTSPKIFEWDNFMSDEECEYIIKLASERQLVKSTVGAETAHAQESSIRTSSQLWIGPGQRNDDPVFLRIRERAAQILRLDLNLAEDTQVVFYEEKQHYYGHHDYSEIYQSNPYYAAGGNRFVTVLYYISDVPSGGHTAFPFANSTMPVERQYMKSLPDKNICTHGPGLRVTPKRGKAVMFYNLLEDKQQEGIGDPATFHLGCDPLDGSNKWLANQWFRNKRVMVNGKMHLYDENW